MKVYNLGCEHQHRFEGWFSSEEDCSAQLARQELACPLCGNRGIARLPSAPRLNLAGMQKVESDIQNQVQEKLLEFTRHIVRNTEDVGDRFAEEARRIHYNEIPERSIRGTASADECEALADEGIGVLQLPMPAVSKQTLQ
ncbi:DUF1178 family protein [Noviherbaspirillum cavernae]|uniref:DUF1178 family protein n=1 Tax=Noviherbaspirillum cavernae TaxID=2320862 RepID=A0A418X602_9BURK|nr:DUF1178 family protein [Noviherbaspirillum cavernae]RJG07898.1 DUF1178 family protein [Noviherbaspirillum cavernae]